MVEIDGEFFEEPVNTLPVCIYFDSLNSEERIIKTMSIALRESKKAAENLTRVFIPKQIKGVKKEKVNPEDIENAYRTGITFTLKSKIPLSKEEYENILKCFPFLKLKKNK